MNMAKLQNKSIIGYLALRIIIFIMISAVFSTSLLAQEDNSDSLFSAKLMEDNLSLFNQVDSLEGIISGLNARNYLLRMQIDSLSEIMNEFNQKSVDSKSAVDSLTIQIIGLQRNLLANKQEILKLNSELENQSQTLRDREFKLAKTELELKEIKSDSEISKVKLEGKLDVHSTKLEGKDKEIAYLKKSIEEKDLIIKEKTNELSSFYKEKDQSLQIIDSLARALNQKELDYIKVSERLKIIESQYNDIMARQAAAANKKKKIRFIQGVGLKTYRTPDWQLAPESASSTNVYVISNKNAGKMDFDYITGISLSLYDLTQEDSKFTYDAGLFVGFGGQNLFKNFYIGPSFKVFDFFHVNLGANIAEYQQLKTGFVEGDPLPVGYSISNITVKEWKTNFYLGFTVDFELLSNIPKKL
jgi:hypothetical protein